MKCHDCGNNYEQISQHWSLSSCEHESFTERQHEIIRGLLMSDAWIDKRVNARFAVAMTNKEFLEWLDQQLQPFSTGVSKKKTDTENREQMYVLRTISHPELNQYHEWYDLDGCKVWGIRKDELTPLTLKMLYVGDGSKYDKNKGRPYIRIGAELQQESENRALHLFHPLGLNPKWNSHNIIFTADDSEKLWDYIGEPPPGFEYKW